MAIAGLVTTSGTEVYIAAGEPSSYSAADLATMGGFEQIVGVVDAGTWGDTPAPISETLLSDGRQVSVNGVAVPNNPAIIVQKRTTDAGMDIVMTNGGTDTVCTILKKKADGSSSVMSGFVSPVADRPSSGQNAEGFTFTFLSATAITRLSASDTTTALA